jgi:hypothetical protein
MSCTNQAGMNLADQQAAMQANGALAQQVVDGGVITVNNASQFAWQMYWIYCGRVPSQAEVAAWATPIYNGTKTFGGVAQEFHNAPEVKARFGCT